MLANRCLVNVCTVCKVCFSTSSNLSGANRHAPITSKKGGRRFHPQRGIQETGFKIGRRWQNYKEMIPEIIVPDLTDFPLKPYVSKKAPDTEEPPLTAKAIFDACIAPEVTKIFRERKYSVTSVGKDER